MYSYPVETPFPGGFFPFQAVFHLYAQGLLKNPCGTDPSVPQLQSKVIFGVFGSEELGIAIYGVDRPGL